MVSFPERHGHGELRSKFERTDNISKTIATASDTFTLRTGAVATGEPFEVQRPHGYPRSDTLSLLIKYRKRITEGNK